MPLRPSLALAILMLAAAPGIADEIAVPMPPIADPAWRGAVLPGQWRPPTPHSDALTIPEPITHDDEIERVTLRQAIAIALQNNPGIAAQRLEPLRQGTRVLEAQATFDPTLSGDAASSHSTTPNASVLGGTTVANTEDRNANLHLFKTFRSGTTATIDFLNDRLDNNSRFAQLRPQYVPKLAFSVVQPLLRNFGWDFSYLVVRVAQEMADAAVYQYEADLANFVEQVIEAYWNVVRTRENLAVQKESKALADRTVDENQARVRVGLLPPVSVLEAQADAQARETQVIQAENALAVARQNLAQLAFFRPEDTFVPRTLEPTEEAEPENVHVDVDRALQVAFNDRPEVQASARGVQAQVLNERIAENGLLPQFNLVGSYGLNGLSGGSQPTRALTTSTTTFLSPVDVSDPRRGIRCAQTTTPTPQAGAAFICTQPPAQSGVNPFAGPAGEAYERLTSNDFRSYSFGVQLQVPLSNAAARGQLTQSRIARSQSELNHRALLSNVTLEVRQSSADVTSARDAVGSARIATRLAEENLRNQERRHEVGMATTKDLLDFQTRLTTARGNEVSAKIDYAIAVARYRRAQGELLTHYQVILERPHTHSAPWFAKF